MKRSLRHVLTLHCVVGVLIIAAVETTSPGIARAVTVIPSYGVAKSMDDDSGEGLSGLAVRASLPFFQVEGGIAYRDESFLGGAMDARQWPVTASAWLSPVPFLYAGGGLGWYPTTFHFDDELQIEDETVTKMGVHLGVGVSVPIAPRFGLDVNGRYIFMENDNDNVDAPTTFEQDFWTTSIGLAITF